MDKNNTDKIGNEFGKDYSLILTDHTFEKRLKRFDKNLKLMFDQNRKLWCILEWAGDNSGWNLLLTAEDEQGKPIPLGEWVFNKLFVWRHNQEVKRNNSDQYFKDFMYEEQRSRVNISGKISGLNRDIAKDELLSFKKVFNEMRNLPVSDVTAGYAKFTPRSNGITAKEITICR